jgi:hypothetical protein
MVLVYNETRSAAAGGLSSDGSTSERAAGVDRPTAEMKMRAHTIPYPESCYCYGSVHPAYNPSFSACFFSRNSIFLSQQISQQRFSAGLSTQPNGGHMSRMQPRHYVDVDVDVLDCMWRNSARIITLAHS